MTEENAEKKRSKDSADSAKDPSGVELKGSAGWSTIGLQMVLAFVIFAWVGQWIDSRYETDPWGVLGGCLLGFISVIIQALKESGRG